MNAKFWFKPKRYGYGATPVTWEGWALTLGVVLVAVGCGLFVSGAGSAPTKVLWLAVGAATVVASIVVAKMKTGGRWQWHWGNRGDSAGGGTG